MTDRHVLLPVLTRGRVFQILVAVDRIAGVPIAVGDLHRLAYLSNVLSPIWDIDVLDGSVLKDNGGPYFPAVQREIDSLVGNGVVVVTELDFELGAGEEVTLRSEYQIVERLAGPILEKMVLLRDVADTQSFLEELVAAFLEIEVDRRDEAAQADASYSDPGISPGRIVDYGEWLSADQSATSNVAKAFQRFVPNHVTLSRAEELVMYMRLLRRRADVS